jgi:NAD(P)-dependent dehydrogenase (short-subunit alcohol dehydrogenase family)
MKVVLVTGASRGIGRGIALALSAAGLRVAVHYNGNRDAALETAQGCLQALSRFTAAADAGESEADNGAGDGSDDIFQADISNAADRERLVTEVTDRYGRIDGLVNNAGVAPRRRDDIVDASEEIFDEVMRVNLYGPYFLTQLVARRWVHLRDGETRRVIFVTSISAEMPSINRGEYCVSKAGLSMAAKLFAVRLAGENILVYEVRPGITETDMTAGVKEKYDRRIADGLVPQRRWGVPSDVGAIARAIMHGDLDFCAGTIIHADGGLHIPVL